MLHPKTPIGSMLIITLTNYQQLTYKEDLSSHSTKARVLTQQNLEHLLSEDTSTRSTKSRAPTRRSPECSLDETSSTYSTKPRVCTRQKLKYALEGLIKPTAHKQLTHGPQHELTKSTTTLRRSPHYLSQATTAPWMPRLRRVGKTPLIRRPGQDLPLLLFHS